MEKSFDIKNICIESLMKNVKDHYGKCFNGGVVDVFCFDGFSVFPGFCDVHVHFREPGFSYKETIKSGSQASARGGYTAVCTMPNLDPVPDTRENILKQHVIIEQDSVIHVYPYASITVGQKGECLADLDESGL